MGNKKAPVILGYDKKTTNGSVCVREVCVQGAGGRGGGLRYKTKGGPWRFPLTAAVPSRPQAAQDE